MKKVMEKKHITAKALVVAKKAVSPLVFPTHDIDFNFSDPESDGTVMDKIMALYKEIPAFECLKGCSLCCGLPAFSLFEWSQIKDRRTSSGHACPYSFEGKCDIYSQRPFMCRWFGISDEPMLRCPFGRHPKNVLTGAEAMELMERYICLIKGIPAIEREEAQKMLNAFQMAMKGLIESSKHS